MNRMRFISGLKFLFLILSSIITIPVANAVQDDYLQLLRSELNKMAADYSASDATASTAPSQSLPEMQATPMASNYSTGRRVIEVKPIANSSNIPQQNNASPPAVYTAGRISYGIEKNNHSQTIDPNIYIKTPAVETGLIKNNNLKTISDVSYLKTFIASSKKSDLGYYYKVLNEGEGRNACSGKVTFHMIESSVTKVKDQDNFTIQCQDLPPVLADGLSKLKKKGQIELLTSAYQVFKGEAIKNGYQENSLIKFNIKSID